MEQMNLWEFHQQSSQPSSQSSVQPTSSRPSMAEAARDGLSIPRKKREIKNLGRRDDIPSGVGQQPWGRPQAKPKAKGSSPTKQSKQVVLPSRENGSASSSKPRVTAQPFKLVTAVRNARDYSSDVDQSSDPEVTGESSAQGRKRAAKNGTASVRTMQHSVHTRAKPASSWDPAERKTNDGKKIMSASGNMTHRLKRYAPEPESSGDDPLGDTPVNTPPKRTTPHPKRQRTPGKKSKDVYTDDSDVDRVTNAKGRTGIALGKVEARSKGKSAVKPVNLVLPVSKPKPKKPVIATESWFAEIEAKRLQAVKTAANWDDLTDVDKQARTALAMFTSSQPQSEPEISEIAGDLIHRNISRKIVARKMFEHLSQDNTDYCELMLDKNSLCPYCSEPLPLLSSNSMIELQIKLQPISTPVPTPENPGARSAPWDQTIGYCSLHKAESTIIPLGIRDGYPSEIDFDAIPSRVDNSSFWHAIVALTEDPRERSTWFRTIVRKIEKQGKRVWQSLAEQSKKKRMNLIQPGYYGDTGKLVLTRHFQRRLQIGDLPALTRIPEGASVPAIRPLTPDEFIINILVPEAAIFLIMQDQGWADKFQKSTFGYETARHKAFETLRASVDFGRALHREDEARVPESLLGEVHRRQTQSARALPLYVPSPQPVRTQRQISSVNLTITASANQAMLRTSIMEGSSLEVESAGSRHGQAQLSPGLQESPVDYRQNPATPSSSQRMVTFNWSDYLDPDEDVDLDMAETTDDDVTALGSKLRSQGSLIKKSDDDEFGGVDDTVLVEALDQAEGDYTNRKDARPIAQNPLRSAPSKRLGMSSGRRK